MWVRPINWTDVCLTLRFQQVKYLKRSTEDLALMLLRIEPEYAFDIPGRQWLAEWFWVAWPGILGISWLMAYAPRWLLPRRVEHRYYHGVCSGAWRL